MASLFKILFSVAHATTTIDLTAGPLSDATNQGPAGFVKGLYLYSLGIVGAAATIMIVYGGVKYVVSGGNEAAKKDAMDILWNSIFGILLLFGAVVILNTINPELTSLKNPDMDIAPSPPTSTPPTTTSSTIPLDAQEAAQRLLNASPSPQFDSLADCQPSGSAAGSVVNDMANFQYPYVCSCGCKTSGTQCVRGGTYGNIYVKASLLYALASLQENKISDTAGHFKINSLTGGDHSCSSSHYTGQAVDISPLSWKQTDWNEYLQAMKGLGFVPACECNGKLNYNSCASCFTDGEKVSGTHIHATF